VRRLAAAALLGLLGAAPTGAEAVAPQDGDPVIGISFRGASRAYPLGAFATRPVLNDVIGRQEVVLFHDTAGGLSAAWFRTVLGEPIEFSGRASGTVADDLSTVTRWNMLTGEAVGGNLAGQRLVGLPFTATSWGSWRAAHPDAEVYAGPP